MKGSKKRKLPDGWQWVRTTDVLDPTIKRPIRMGPFGSQLKKDELVEDGIFVLGIEHVIQNKFNDKGLKFITEEKFEELKGFEVQPGEVLMTTMGTIGRTTVVPSEIRKSIISSHLLKLTLKKNIYSEYISWILGNNSPVFKNLTLASQGAIMKGLNTDIVKNLYFPIPTEFNEQISICKVLNQRMAEVEKTHGAALRQKEAAKALKEKIISKALPFKNGDRLPEEWRIVRCQDVVDVRDGTHDTPSYVDKGIPLVTSKNLKDGDIDFESIKFISVDDHNEIERRSKVDEGDILFAMIGTIGNPVIVKKDRDFSIKNVALFKFKNSPIIPAYFYYLLSSEFIKEQLFQATKGGIQNFVSLEFLRNLAIPIPSNPDVQKDIVNILNRNIKDVERVNQAVDNQLKAIQALPAAILREVFDFQEPN